MNRTEQPNLKRIVIVGGGISGLAAAHALIEHKARSGAQIEVLLLEAGDRSGGTIHTHHRDGFLLEAGPDSFISEKPEAVELAEQLGLGPHLIETNNTHRRSFVVRGGRLHPTPEGFQLLAPSRFWPLVTTGIFSWAGKARMALDLVLPRRADVGDHFDESLAHFVRRRFGAEALERMAQPMVAGIYTADPELLSLRATMPRFLEMERAHRSVIWALWRGSRKQTGTSGARYSLFLSLDGGMQLLTDRLAEQLSPGVLRLRSRVESISFDGEAKRWHLRLAASPHPIVADGVCLALPAYAAADLLRATDARLAAELAAINYASTATINLAYRREDIPHPLDGFGFVVPFIERRTILACTFSSVKFAGRAPDRHALLRAFVGGALQPEMFALDEEAMTAAVCQDLRALLGVVKPPLFTLVEKWPRSMAQYSLGHLERMDRIRDRLQLLPSLQLAGNAYGGAGIPDCIRGAKTAARNLATMLRAE